MKNKRLLFALSGAGVLAVVFAAAALWYFFLRSDEPAPVSIDAAANTASGGDASGVDTSSDLSGTWTIAPAGGSFAGYRVNENLVSFGSKTAVGRTQTIQGSLTYDGASITGVQVTADLTALKSDQPLRDDTLKMQAIQSCQFPTAIFTLGSPISLDQPATAGGTVSKAVQGNLTLHGVTRPVTLDIKGRFQNGQVVVVGSTDVKFADYNISQPRSFLVVSLDDHGVMEFQLIFTKATGTATPAPAVSATPSGCQRGFPPGGGQPPSGPPPGGQPQTFPGLNTPAPTPPPVD